jgi:hypothetical protein
MLIGKEPNKDVIEHPSHYTSGGIETIDYLKATLSKAEFEGFLKGNILKYTSRAGKKDDNPKLQDLKKAAYYLNLLIKVTEDDKGN